jgi:hypothetical protein
MPRRPGVQLTRNSRADGSTTFSLRVRVAGGDERVPLGNANDGWDEARAERAREQLLAKIELGLWTPRSATGAVDDDEPLFRELASDWFEARRVNPAIRPATLDGDRWALARYLIPFFGDLLPSQITPLTVKRYRRHIHEENVEISAALEAGTPIVDRATDRSLRPISNSSINKTLLILAAVLDEAETPAGSRATSPEDDAPASRWSATTPTCYSRTSSSHCSKRRPSSIAPTTARGRSSAPIRFDCYARRSSRGRRSPSA